MNQQEVTRYNESLRRRQARIHALRRLWALQDRQAARPNYYRSARKARPAYAKRHADAIAELIFAVGVAVVTVAMMLTMVRLAQ